MSNIGALTTSAALPQALKSGQLMAQAKALEATFLAEMLGHGGLIASNGAFGEGTGEGQFDSFLRTEQAKQMVEKGGIGLAEVIFRAMSGATDAN